MLLRYRKGISLVEMILTLLVVVLAISTLVGVYKQRVQSGYMDQTVSDMLAIADATLNYKTTTGNWPAGIADLVPAYLPAAVTQNAFGDPFSLVCATGKVSVSSKVPQGLVNNTSLGPLMEVSSAGAGVDLVTITRREQIGAMGRLQYDKKYFYHE